MNFEGVHLPKDKKKQRELFTSQIKKTLCRINEGRLIFILVNAIIINHKLLLISDLPQAINGFILQFAFGLKELIDRNYV